VNPTTTAIRRKCVNSISALPHVVLALVLPQLYVMFTITGRRVRVQRVTSGIRMCHAEPSVRRTVTVRRTVRRAWASGAWTRVRAAAYAA